MYSKRQLDLSRRPGAQLGRREARRCRGRERPGNPTACCAAGASATAACSLCCGCKPVRSAGCAQSSTTCSRTRWPSTRKRPTLSTRARLATTHASDWACGRQGEGHSPEHARMTSDHTRLLPKAEGDTCSLPTYNKKCSHTVRSGSSVNRGPDPLTRLAAVVSVRHSPGDSLFRFAKTNRFRRVVARNNNSCCTLPVRTKSSEESRRV